VRYVMGTSGDQEPSAQLTDRALAAKVTRKARCADGTVDPDEWFPVSTDAEAARREAARAIAICTACPVRGACLELSLRHWTIGQHGVWGGLVAADRAALRRGWLASPHEYGRALSILDRIWDGPPATSHAGRGDQSAAAALTSRRALSGMRAVRMARALLRHLTAAAPGRDQARPGRPQDPSSRLGPADGPGTGQADAGGGRRGCRAASPRQAGYRRPPSG
jgi:Transcription factor WhiB